MTTTYRLLLLFVFVSGGCAAVAQMPASFFSFNCAKDTTIQCSDSCITLKTTIPKIMNGTDAYVVSRIPGGCFQPVDFNAAPGSAINLTVDDQYSSLVSLPFDFPFYGIFYNQLVASTNGYVSFDDTKASSFSHYGILNSGGGLSAGTGTPEDLPSSLYDRALIMAAYQDIDISLTSSPTRKISYKVTGTYPHRKWVLNYYKVPLYLNSCNNLIENTQQLELDESSGIIEVFIFSRQICNDWNNGRAMIGLQNYDRDLATMAPGRAASDAPWGTIGMDEAWRFTPSSGQALLKKVELYTLAGNLVSVGTTSNADPGNYRANFTNVCPDSTTTYLVKSTYKRISDALQEFYGVDTITIHKPVADANHSTWTGAADNEWDNPGNWACGNLPGAASDVFIDHGTIHVNSNITLNSLTVQPGASIVIAPGFNITLLGNPH